MREYSIITVSRECKFEKSGESIRIQITFEDVSPQKYELAKEHADVLYKQLKESL